MSDIENTLLDDHDMSSLQEVKETKFSFESDLREEKTRTDVIRRDLLEATKARESLEALLTNIKENNGSLEQQLNSEAYSRTQHEKEFQKHERIWESEAKSRAMNLRVFELEKQLEELRCQVEQEKQRSRRAVEQKRSADNKNEIFQKRSVQHQQEVSSLRNKLKQYQRRVKECEANNSRIPALHAEFEIERQTASSNLSKLRRQIDKLSEQLSREQEMRGAEEKKNREQLNELGDLKKNEKVHRYELERLHRKCGELQLELQRQKEYYQLNFCPVEEIQEFKKALETKARIDLNKKLEDVNMHLEEQSLVREAYDKLRNGIEKKTKTGFEETVNQLKNDLTEVKASLSEGLVKRDTSVMEAQRFKELFECERNNTRRLAEELAKSTEMLNYERSRSSFLLEDTLNKSKSKVTKKMFEESLEKDQRNSFSPPVKDCVGVSPSVYRSNLWSTPVASSSIKRHGY